MATGAFSDITILGLTYQDESVSSLQTRARDNNKHESRDKKSYHIVKDDALATNVPSLDPEEPCICTHEDFIIFSEFSEVQGPMPILTIPSHIQDKNDIDMNSFILKIMSVDYQANQSSGQFAVCDDVQLMQLSVMQGMHAYAHYFTLYDLQARGFVRPMCLAYVTRDDKKLISSFPSLGEQFLKMTELIKYNNRREFLDELYTKIHNLKGRQEMYFQLKRDQEEVATTASNHLVPGSPGIQPLVQQYTEFRHLQHVIENVMENEHAKGLQHILINWEIGIRNFRAQPEIQEFTQTLQHSSKLTGALRPVLAISPWGCLSALWGLSGILHSAIKCPLQVPLTDLWGMHQQDGESKDSNMDISEQVQLALESPEFLSIIRCLTFPKEHTKVKENTKTSDVNYLTSAVNDLRMGSIRTESGCSFHSAQETTELSSSDDSQPDMYEEAEAEGLELWTACICSGSHSNPPSPQIPGVELWKLFTGFPQAAQHLVYAILSGRPVVLAGFAHQQDLVLSLCRALGPLLPPTGTARKQPQVLRWHRGIIVSDHLNKYSIIGLCVPERHSFHDMLNSKDKNRVTILEVGSQDMFGPAYSGQLLASLDISRCTSLVSLGTQTLLLLLRTILTDIVSKVHVARSLQKTSPIPGIRGCDLLIVRHLAATLPPT